MTPLRPTPDDVEDLARIHVQAWAETYSGLLPEDEIARHGLALRRRQWAAQVVRQDVRIAWLPGLGFAQAGPQRDAGLRAAGWPEELYALYLLRAGQGRGLGRALFAAVRGEAAAPMTALVLEGNEGACRFYEAAGARHVETRDERIGQSPIRERVYGWGDPPRP